MFKLSESVHTIACMGGAQCLVVFEAPLGLPWAAAEVELGSYPIVALEKQPPKLLGNLV
jgi:hypothetical protein